MLYSKSLLVIHFEYICALYHVNKEDLFKKLNLPRRFHYKNKLNMVQLLNIVAKCKPDAEDFKWEIYVIILN